MRKIPVIPTIKAAYGFVFAQLGTIIGLIWIPMVLVTVLGFFVEQRYYAAAADALASDNYARLGPSVISLFCYFVAAILLYAMMLVPVTQLALGQRKEGAIAHFALGLMERRMFRALASLAAFLILPVMISAFLFNTVAMTTPSAMSAPMMAGLETLLLLSYFALAYIALRFAFLLPVVAVNEDRPALPHAWMLSAGNFWRILAIMAATLGPVALAAAAAQLLLEGRTAMVPHLANSSAMAAAQLHLIALNMPVSKGLDFLVAPLLLGLGVGASAGAMRALQGSESA
jgi:hypothetical protein